MFRTIKLLLLVGIIIGAIEVFTNYDGNIQISWENFQINLSLLVFLIILSIVILCVLHVVKFFKFVSSAPKKVEKYLKSQEEKEYIPLIISSIEAIILEDKDLLEKCMKKLSIIPNNNTLQTLLKAYLAKANSDFINSNSYFNQLLGKGDGKALALKELLYLNGDNSSVLAKHSLIEQTYNFVGKKKWMLYYATNFFAKTKNWPEYSRNLEIIFTNNFIDEEQFNNKKACCYLIQALYFKEIGDKSKALTYVNKSLEYESNKVIQYRAVLEKIDLLIDLGKNKTAIETLKLGWQINPSKALRSRMLKLFYGYKEEKLLDKVKETTNLNQNHPETYFTLARVALNENMITIAKEYLEYAKSFGMTQELSKYMIEIEAKKFKDIEIANWLDILNEDNEVLDYEILKKDLLEELFVSN